MDYKKIIAQNLVIQDVSAQEIEASIVEPLELKNGEYSLPCFKFSRALRLAPQVIAQKLAENFGSFEWLQGVEAVNGYLNFKLNRQRNAKDVVLATLARGKTFAGFAPNNKTICLDYSSINIAKPFHIGHLLTTAIGGSLYKIYKYLGYNAVGINHLGDWGTQFGKLIVAYKKWGSDDDIAARNIHALLDLYVKFHAEAEKDESLNEESRRWFKKIEDGDAEALDIFNKFKSVTLQQVQKIYDRLGVSFDSYAGESFYNNMLSDVVDELKSKNLLTESDGAKVVDLTEYSMPPCLILKSDGASLYATRDLAAAKYRKQHYNFDKCLYVVAYQQNLHFSQVFKVLQLMGYDWAADCVHVPFGMVSLENSGALSTRKGNVVFLSDVLESAVNKANSIIQQKNPALENKAEVAENVGVGAIIFSALDHSKIKDMVFSLDKALEFDGETAPYIQYTYARCCSILAKGECQNYSCADFGALTDDESTSVIKLIAKFDDVVLDAALKYEPSILARYLIDVAQSFNKFYMLNRIIGEAKPITEVRLSLTACVASVLENGLSLILIKAPTKM